jgi:hypothetical protein
MVSLMNGLSALGSGIADYSAHAGLEAQRADLQQQGIRLAADLAHQNRSSEIEQSGTIAERAAAKGNEYALAQGKQQGEFLVQGHQISANATLGAAAMSAGASRYATDHPTEVTLLERLGVLTPRASAATGGGMLNSGGGSAPAGQAGTTAASTPPSNGVPGHEATAGIDAGPQSGAAPTPLELASQNPLADEIIRKAVGIAQPGSEADLRRITAMGVENDPKFKDKSPEEKAAETMMRIAVQEGKMTDPVSRHLMAVAIAGYQMAPISGFGETKPGGPETMAEVFKINPNYQATRYPEVQKAMTAFGSGTEGDRTRFLNSTVQHMEVFRDAAQKLQNGTFVPSNRIVNYFKEQFGQAPPTTLEGLAQLVGTEIERAATGGIGASADRERLIASLGRDRSGPQITDMLDRYQSLMAAQLKALKRQYEDATGFTSGPFAFENKLDPETRARLTGASAPSNGGSDASGAVQPSAPTDGIEYGNALRGRGRTPVAPAAPAPPAAEPAPAPSPSLMNSRGAPTPVVPSSRSGPSFNGPAAFPPPTPAAISILKNDPSPSTRGYFDATFGAGAADRVLRGQNAP